MSEMAASRGEGRVEKALSEAFGDGSTNGDRYGSVYLKKYSGSAEKPASGGMSNADCPFLVRVTVKDLGIRKGARTDTAWTEKYVPVGTYTIVEVKEGKGSDAGWGRLKSGAGFIALDYAKA